jgi:hypothetical protein
MSKEINEQINKLWSESHNLELYLGKSPDNAKLLISLVGNYMEIFDLIISAFPENERTPVIIVQNENAMKLLRGASKKIETHGTKIFDKLGQDDKKAISDMMKEYNTLADTYAIKLSIKALQKANKDNPNFNNTTTGITIALKRDPILQENKIDISAVTVGKLLKIQETAKAQAKPQQRANNINDANIQDPQNKAQQPEKHVARLQNKEKQTSEDIGLKLQDLRMQKLNNRDPYSPDGVTNCGEENRINEETKELKKQYERLKKQEKQDKKQLKKEEKHATKEERRTHKDHARRGEGEHYSGY